MRLLGWACMRPATSVQVGINVQSHGRASVYRSAGSLPWVCTHAWVCLAMRGYCHVGAHNTHTQPSTCSCAAEGEEGRRGLHK